MATSQQADLPAGVLLENLVTHKESWRLASHLFRMLVSVGVISTDILSIAVDRKRGSALVTLRTREAEQFLVSVFYDVRNVLNFFDVRKVCARPVQLKMSPRSVDDVTARSMGELPASGTAGHRQPRSDIEPNQITDDVSISESSVTINNTGDSQETPITQDTPFTQDTPITQDSLADQEGRERRPTEPSQLSEDNALTETRPSTETTPSSDSSSTGIEFEILEELDCTKPEVLDASTSTSGFPSGSGIVSSRGEEGEEEDEEEEEGPPLKVDVKTSTPQMGPCFCPETIFYHRWQHVGTESRHAEFKRGGVVKDRRHFRTQVGKYMCAFLNTEGGTIYFGVTDDGRVLGIKVDQRSEDQIRLTIDDAVGMIRPAVPPDVYSINFAKLMNDRGIMEKNLAVLEICIKPRQPPSRLYSFDHVSYVRRDGSLRTVDPDIR